MTTQTSKNQYMAGTKGQTQDVKMSVSSLIFRRNRLQRAKARRRGATGHSVEKTHAHSLAFLGGWARQVNYASLDACVLVEIVQGFSEEEVLRVGGMACCLTATCCHSAEVAWLARLEGYLRDNSLECILVSELSQGKHPAPTPPQTRPIRKILGDAYALKLGLQVRMPQVPMPGADEAGLVVVLLPPKAITAPAFSRPPPPCTPPPSSHLYRGARGGGMGRGGGGRGSGASSALAAGCGSIGTHTSPHMPAPHVGARQVAVPFTAYASMADMEWSSVPLAASHLDAHPFRGGRGSSRGGSSRGGAASRGGGGSRASGRGGLEARTSRAFAPSRSHVTRGRSLPQGAGVDNRGRPGVYRGASDAATANTMPQ